MNHRIPTNEPPVVHPAEVVIVGGGVTGCVAAIAAARLGVQTVLIHNRPVFGGPSSTECSANADGSFVCGASEYVNANARECGIIDELKTEARYRKSVGHDQHWSLLLREWVEREPAIQCLLNTEAYAVETDGPRIRTVTARTLESGLTWRFEAPLFIDCSGDSFLGFAAGAEFRHGREGRDEFNESLAPETPDRKTMGSSISFRAIDVGHPVPFKPPPWAMKFTSDAEFPFRPHTNPRKGYWWLEYGGELDTLADNETIYRKLLSLLFGIWDHVKNHGDHGADHFVINWISSLPAKRESRRLMGDYLLTQRDLLHPPGFPDAVAYGGWPIDLHPPEGFFAKGHPGSPPPFIFPGTYPIPFRCLYSRTIENLMMAGRNISVTHVALGTTRVMATCALLGQAVGTAAFLAIKYGVGPRAIATDHARELRHLLYREDAALPESRCPYPFNLASRARVTAESTMRLSRPGPIRDAMPLLAPPRDPAVYDPCNEPPADRRRAQMFPVSSEHLRRITVYFNHPGPADAEVELSLHPAKGFNDFTPTPALRSVTQAVPPGRGVAVTFDLDVPVTPGDLYYFVLSATPGVEVCLCRRYLPGLYLKPDGCYPANDHLAFEMEPPQDVFGGENVINGLTRAGRQPNMWLSDPDRPLPQSLTLTFDMPRTVSAVEFLFDTNLHHAPTTGAARECVRDYRLCACVAEQWETVLEIRDNYFRRRCHHFPPVHASALRLTVTATQGDPSARVYEVRVFEA